MLIKTKQPITIKDGKLEIPHLGISLRAIMGAAIKNLDSVTRQTAHVIPVYYKGTEIAAVTLGKDFR